MKRKAFTIIELLTVMTIIIILIGILAPSINATRRYAKVVAQKAQFHDISKGLEMFRIDFEDYPDSTEKDFDDNSYCGSMKLCEAMVGQDGLGFHIDSQFTSDDLVNGVELYPPSEPLPYSQLYIENLRSRKLPYINTNKVELCVMRDLYKSTSPFDPCSVMISDVFNSKKGIVSGERIGMPVLYYKADTTKLSHDLGNPNYSDNVYNYMDNDELVELQRYGVDEVHPLFADPNTTFYEDTWNENVSTTYRPYNADSYILISAGWDGLYGTEDDIHNFKD